MSNKSEKHKIQTTPRRELLLNEEEREEERDLEEERDCETKRIFCLVTGNILNWLSRFSGSCIES